MAKTDVILIRNVPDLGGESDRVTVAAGYARNYLVPHGLAVPLTAANKRRLAALQQRRVVREAHELNATTELAKSLAKMVLMITVKTGDDGKMFGSVTASQIADELKGQFEVDLERRRIELEQPIRALGDHKINLRLHSDVTAALQVRIKSSNPQVEEREQASLAAEKKKTTSEGPTKAVKPA